MRKRVLIVDDRDDLRDFLADALTSLGGDLRILTAANGAAALASIAEHGTDLVITDLDMPVMNGIELIRALRATPPAPPIIVISGASTDWIAGEAAEELRDLPFLRKPLALSDLLRVVAEQLAG